MGPARAQKVDESEAGTVVQVRFYNFLVDLGVATDTALGPQRPISEGTGPKRADAGFVSRSWR